jgi:hypothetical protein
MLSNQQDIVAKIVLSCNGSPVRLKFCLIAVDFFGIGFY